jgi:hypothetical protein
MTQYVAVEFAPGGRAYTYRNDGAPLAVGDRVRVATKNEGEKTVTVTAINVVEPKFETKPVLGKVEAETKEEA